MPYSDPAKQKEYQERRKQRYRENPEMRARAQAARQARIRVGVVPQMDNLDPDFTARENLVVVARRPAQQRDQTGDDSDQAGAL
jgi:ABC-type multidrug transport system ATPase subunit